ncbi:alpha-N-arabinofuranosidase [Alteriqipengyuania lutimaris]|nr:alpha-L-arabinofuranosidase C-terminal domain-containing protein [Alteriqipengyuania lutimaris]MBB3032400.1 alpha-N-arabinofuranosidase [Alteriqipengyuania lutimaris]
MRRTLRGAAIAIAGVASLGVSGAMAQQPAQNVSVEVDFDATGPRIEPEVQGHFAEHLGRGIYEGVWVGEDSAIPNTDGFRTDVLVALQQLEIPVVRWPGGCFADEYDWRDGIGPRAERPVRLNTHWGWVIEDNAFGTHEFLNYSEALGAKPYVAGNMGSLPAVEMARWMEYMTGDLPTDLAEMRRANGRDEPWDVPYFGIGNESWGCGGNMQPSYSADLHRRYSTFVKAPPGKSIVKVATGANVDDYNFTETLMREARHTMDAISIHYYTFPGSWEDKGPATGFGRDQWASTLSHALRMDELVTNHVAIMDKHDPEGRVDLYVDEWGTWYDSEPGSTPGFLYQQNSLRDALVVGLTMNVFHDHTRRVKMANIAQMVNVLQASILTDGEEMLLTPTYHALDMYRPFRGAVPLQAEVDTPRYVEGEYDLPLVDVSVARGEDGKLIVSLINLSPDTPARVATNLEGTASGRIITGPELDTHNTFDNPERITPAPYAARSRGGELVFDLPAKSLVVVTID